MKRFVLIVVSLIVGVWIILLASTYLEVASKLRDAPISKAVYSSGSSDHGTTRVNLDKIRNLDYADKKAVFKQLIQEGFKEETVDNKKSAVERETLSFKRWPNKSKNFDPAKFFSVKDQVFVRWIKIHGNLMRYKVVVVSNDDGVELYGIKRCAICM